LASARAAILPGRIDRPAIDSTRTWCCWPIFQSRTEAATAIGRYIDGFYNPVRRHSALDFISPLQFEGRAA
jgi:hypothetical protein